ncbi:RagB/SusD family nutrient uptake outer membrane protein [Mucilaginibacter jinjuensis]|uniref:RagB/SusD family nutrient uptake outer membrane protein n=1 Tax=Mucilaginibacter jinjuensis TaxID=1176721 RepID=A0ABY7T600_9SPHI|nr:RagB/SusD family nutrient uptake outer membrane protein [Mucilaginibacter jinjuensis]WCT11142.1 RagB/SusD family nutrient uptake outer membrane protein [Mucilaginibacter jinjuensis]
MKKRYILFALAGLVLASCKKQLEEKPYSILTNTNFYTNATDAQAAINGVLSQLQPQAYYQRTIYIMTELSGDCLVPLLTQNQERIDMYKLTYGPTNIEITNWWQNSYKLISRANDVIANVPKINMDVTARNNIVGNAMFLRGMAYFDLVRSFGDVPLITAPIVSTSDPNLLPARAASSAVYAQVISDLKYAEANCLTEDKITSANKGMVSSAAASGMLARVYLQRASTKFADANDNQNALAECNKVINAGTYKLMADYTDVFNWDKKYYPTQTENIFSVQFGNNSTSTTQNITIRMFSPAGLGGSGSFTANPWLFNSAYFGPDKRKAWNVSNKVGTTTVTPYIYKYRDPQWVSGSNNSRMNWIVLRYADILMMQSEAMNNINPGDPTKFDGLNAVRDRAGMNAYHLTLANTPTASAFIDTLAKDRARELCVEGHRRWDLLRWGKFKSVIQAVNGFTAQDYQLLLPLPQTEMDANPNLKPQNPGY